MCGFVAVWRHPSRGPVREEELRALLPDLRHRGPDSEGVVVRGQTGIAATRLAIQGGSQADQPYAPADGSIHVAFNGEILPTETARLRSRLRQRGAAPPSEAEGDTGLVAAALRAGICGGCVTMGAMGSLVVVNDRGMKTQTDELGIKPQHCAGGSGEVWISSQVTPLLRRAPDLRRASPPGLAELLRFHRPRHEFPFDGVSGTPRDQGGGAGVWPVGEGDHFFDEPPLPAGDPPAQVREVVRRAAREAAAVPESVAIFLSGGIDSSAVAAFAERPDLVALTGRFGPLGGAYDESEGATATAKHLGLRHVVVDLRDEDLLADLPDVIRALEIPIAGPGSLALWRLAKEARRHARVVLTGTGGDELFGGYARTALALGRSGAWTAGYETLERRMDAAGSNPWDRLRVAMDRTDDLRPFLAREFLVSLPPIDDRFELEELKQGTAEILIETERRETLPSLLHVEDRVTMAHGLEGRPVLCLGDVPRVARDLPDEWLVGPDGEGKRALREALRGAIPESVRTDRRKRGFPTPFARAVRGAGRERAMEILHDRRFVERGWWDVDACRRAVDEERPGHDRGLFAMLSWEVWARLFLDGDAFRA